MILMPMKKAEDEKKKKKRIREALKKTPFSPVPGREIFITVSIGLSQYVPAEDMKAFVRRVDDIMYQAKHQGRDRICTG